MINGESFSQNREKESKQKVIEVARHDTLGWQCQWRVNGYRVHSEEPRKERSHGDQPPKVFPKETLSRWSLGAWDPLARKPVCLPDLVTGSR